MYSSSAYFISRHDLISLHWLGSITILDVIRTYRKEIWLATKRNRKIKKKRNIYTKKKSSSKKTP